jgi:uncharacterized protein (TIGR03000 family)
MTKRWFTGAAVLGLAVSAMLLSPAQSQAQRRGGWGGGGWGRSGVGGVGAGYGRGGNGYGYPGFGYGGYGYGDYGRGYSGDGYRSGYYGYASPYSYGNNYGYDYSSPYASAPTYGDYQSFYPPQAGRQQGNQQQAGAAAHLMIQVPDPNAQVWLEGQQMNQQGMSRQFYSPPLEPNREYSYTVKASWMENGQRKEQTKEVDVRAGQQATVRFGGQAQNSDLNRDLDRTRELNRDLNRDLDRNRNIDPSKNPNRATTPNLDKLPPPPPVNPDKKDTDRIDK